MKKSMTFLGAITVSAGMLFTACKSSDSNAVGKDEKSTSIFSKDEIPGRYGIKSGIIHYNYKMSPMDGKQIVTFDDNGEKLLTNIQMNMMGQKTQTNSLQKDGYIYTWQDGATTGQKMKLDLNQDINYQNLSDSVKKMFEIEKMGTETVMNKPTDIYSMNMKQYNGKGKAYIWKGIPLKTEVNVQGMNMVITAESLEENPSIPANAFDVPADVTFTETSMKNLQLKEVK